MPSNRDERLADVYARADQIRTGRRRRLGLAGLAVAVVALGTVVALVPDRGAEEVRVAAGPSALDDDPIDTSTTTDTSPEAPLPTEPPPVTTSLLTTGPTFVTTTITSTPTPTPTPTPTTTSVPTTSSPPTTEVVEGVGTTSTSAPCRNSTEERCGEFRYDPEPANEPMVVRMGAAPAHIPVAGAEVFFEVLASDDGPLTAGSCTNSQNYGDGGGVGVCTASCEPSPPRYGPWDPPAPEQGRLQEVFRHVYERPGTYEVVFAYNDGSDCDDSPYRSTGEVRTTVVVQ